MGDKGLNSKRNRGGPRFLLGGFQPLCPDGVHAGRFFTSIRHCVKKLCRSYCSTVVHASCVPSEHFRFFKFSIQISTTLPVADLGGGSPDPLPLLKLVKKRWPPCGAASSRGHRTPLGQISGSATASCLLPHEIIVVNDICNRFCNVTQLLKHQSTRSLFAILVTNF